MIPLRAVGWLRPVQARVELRRGRVGRARWYG